MASDVFDVGGIVGTGPKFRIIKASDVSINSSFEFNKSITPHGGTESSIFVSKTKKGFARVKLYQDLNDDGVISRKEIIYKGKCHDPYSGNELLNFNGNLKLSKTMHMCEWLGSKNPSKIVGCTRELIPTVYSLTLTDESGEIFDFDSIGQFKTIGNVL